MPTILKARRVHNPGKKKKRLTPKQIRFFGTKAQKAGLKRKRKNSGKRKRQRNFPGGSRIHSWSSSKKGKSKPIKRHVNKGRKRQFNVGEILTAGLAGNPGRKRMTKRKNRKHRKSAYKARSRRKNTGRVRRRRSRKNSSPRVVVRYRNRSRRRKASRRKNPGSFLSGKIGKVVGVIAGATVTALIANNFVPAQFNTGIMGYVATGIVAFAQGKLVGKVTRNAALGQDMVVGGLAYLALKVIADFVPSIANMIPLSLRGGMGLIAPSSFYVPQVNQPGSMSSFVSPAASMIAAPVAMAGMGRGRRVGRMGY